MDRDKLFKLLPWIITPILLALIVVVWKLYTTYSGISEYVIPTPRNPVRKQVAAPRRR